MISLGTEKSIKDEHDALTYVYGKDFEPSLEGVLQVVIVTADFQLRGDEGSGYPCTEMYTVGFKNAKLKAEAKV